MLRRLLAVTLMCASLFAQQEAQKPAPGAAPQAAAQEPASPPEAKKEEPNYDMGVVRLTLAKKTAKQAPNAAEIWQQHVDYWVARMNDGTALAAGKLEGHPEYVGMSVVNAPDADADRITAADPAVAAGLLEVTPFKWFTARNIYTKPAQPVKWKTYYFGFLMRGDKWTPEVTVETRELQRGHMANINRLAEMGKLVLAGPMSDAGDWRGIFVFSTETIEEARQLTDTDPAVRAGRLKLEIYPWQVPAGVLPSH